MDLPCDINCIIMTKLPVKTLIRFLIVSKTWYNLIQDLQFQKSHINNTLTQSFILSRKDYSSFKELYLLEKQNTTWNKNTAAFTLNPILQEKLGLKIITTCNGLLCLSDRGSFLSYNYRKVGLIIYNPVTRGGVMLPEVVLQEDYNTRRPTGVNFGYDTMNNKYKVAILCSSSLVSIITVGDKSWRKLNYSQWMKVNTYHYFKQQIASSNKDFFWLIDEFYSREILVLDISDEKFRVIKLEELQCVNQYHYRMVYGKYLTLIVTTCIEAGKSGKRMQIWELVNGTWKHKEKRDRVFRQEVDVLSTAEGDCLLLKLRNPYGYSPKPPSEFVIYNPKNGEVSSLLSPDDSEIYDVFSFVPTLVSLEF